MNKIPVGIIGVGHLGKIHASLYKDVELAEVVGVYDSDTEKAKKVAEELDIKAFLDRDQLLDQVDAVNIVTPTSTHYETANHALDHECHLFIESHRLASFNPRGTDVAVILDLMIHDLDMILSLVKSKPVQIDANGVGVVSDTIDIANARIQFESGCVANVTASRISTKKMRKMRIFQHNSYISVDFTEGFSEIYYSDENDTKTFKDGTLAFSLGQIEAGNKRRNIKYNKLQKDGINPLKYELNAFMESIQANISPLVTGEEGLAALTLANQVLEKIEENTKKVTVETNE
jgi:predicted dehydrogenase